MASDHAVRQRITGAVKSALFRGGLIALSRRLGAPGRHLPVVRYHSVSEAPDYCPHSISIPAALFEREIRYLASRYRVITLEEGVRCLLEGRPFPERGVVITFDDGYKDNVTAALPVLRRHGASAMFYVATGPVLRRERFWVGWLHRAVFGADDARPIAEAFGMDPDAARDVDRQALVDAISRRINTGALEVRHRALSRVEAALGGAHRAPDGADFMMNEQDLRTLVDAGMEIGAHTVSHPVLTGLPDDEALAELRESRTMLEAALGRPIEHLAYPNGVCERNFDRNTVRLAREAGFTSAATSERGSVGRDDDPLALPRHGVNHMLGMGAFAFKIEEHRFGPLLLR